MTDQIKEIIRRAVTEPTEWMISTPQGEAIMAQRQAAYDAACRQTNCAGRGFNPKDCGNCAMCADMVDHVVEAHSAANAERIMQGVIDALDAAGYVIVPKVPTEEMVAGATACSLKLGQYEEIWAAMIEEGRSAETGTHNKGKG
jgi:hypothetical protein